MFVLAEDEALKNYLQGLTVSDNLSTSRPVKVWFGYPDIEVRDQTFPFITIDLIDITPGNNRQIAGYLGSDDLEGQVNQDPNYLYAYRIPIAYDLIYQVSAFSRHPRHDRALINQLHRKFPSKYGYLEVPVELGTYTTSRSMFVDGFVKRDTVDSETGNRRLFRNIYTVRVLSQMPPEVAESVYSRLVETVQINTTTSYIPSELTPVKPIVIP